ncbi:IS3 family transposase [Roseomonas nepalensis]|uniref:IS3 family transposase n=1 Tax=Muricoccus nepalensis TaxID=1854500 RepID=A0A502FVT5_9PROT|nr:IS3 family transposase [Roseomonas nepalensis]
MRFRFIEDHREMFLVRVMCSVLEVSASGYYAWRGRSESIRSQANQALLGDIRRVHAESRRRYGSPRVHAALQAEGQRVGHNRVARLMRQHGIGVRTKRRFRVTTDSKHSFPVAPNLLDRQFTASGPNRVWLADMTYIPTGEGWLYLAVVLDLFSRKVVGWAMRETMAQELTIAALQMAITNRRPGPELLLHSDRGSQYAAHGYRRLLAKHGMLCSMSRKGDCWDNAPMESFFGSLKTELGEDEPFPTRQAARSALFAFIEAFYNRTRGYRRLLAKHGMLCSMSRKGDCWDNAPMESFFGSLKTELGEDEPFPTRQAARSALFAFIEAFYNRTRLHSAIGYKAPAEMEQLAAAA